MLFLDYLLALFHVSLTIFNVVGWMFSKTRRLQLLTMALTLGAWLIAGMWYGLGYCPLTDWHWDIKRKLGEVNLPASCIKYYADKFFQQDFDSVFVNNATGFVMAVLVIVTLIVNIKERRTSK